jgi:hypothetical protein
MTFFGSSGKSIEHVPPSECGFFQAKFVVKDPQARRLSNAEVATKYRVFHPDMIISI